MRTIAIERPGRERLRLPAVSGWQGWIPWVIVSVVVIVWTHLKVAAIGQQTIHWPGLHNAVFITLYNKGLCRQLGIPAARHRNGDSGCGNHHRRLVGVGPGRFLGAIAITWRQSRMAILTVALIVGLAYLMNYSGMNYTLGLGVASAGIFFPMLSAFLGWVAVFLSGSDTSGNALFGNLQVVAANQLGLNPVLIAATNSSGGVMGKMISPQNIATGVSVTHLQGPGGPGTGAHLQAQHRPDAAAGRARGAAAVRVSVDDSVSLP